MRSRNLDQRGRRSRPAARQPVRALFLLLALMAGMLPFTGAAQAHGTIVNPASRAYQCWQDWGHQHMNPAMQQQDPMCWQAWQADSTAMWNWNSLYIDGVNTLFVFGPLIAVGLFGFAEAEILLFGVTIYLAAGLGAFAMGWLDDIVGSKRVILASIACIVALAVVLSALDDKTAFWIVAGVLAVFFGPIQSSSRSLMVRLSPPDRRTKLFGIYALAGRATAPLGPAAVSWAILASGSQRMGILVVAGFLVAGGLLLLPVRERRANRLAPGEIPEQG